MTVPWDPCDIFAVAMEEYFKIGKIAAASGTGGQLLLVHHLGRKTSLAGLEHIFLEDSPGSFLPYFLVEARAKSDTEVYLLLEGTATREAALRLLKKDVWLAASDAGRFSSPGAPLSLLGYIIMEGDRPLGEIREVIEQPHQVLCRIDLEGREAFIPLHDQTLERIDRKTRKVFVQLPEGLLDIYK